MKLNTPSSTVAATEKIAALVHTLRETELELQTLTGGQLDAIVGAGGSPYLLRQAQERLAQSEERFRILFDLAPEAIFLHDLRGTFVDGNQAAEALLGYTKQELVGKSFLNLNLLKSEERPRAAATLGRSALGEPTGPAEYVLNRKDGCQVSVEVRTFPIKIGKQSLVLGIARDITDQRMAREQLEKTAALMRIAGRVARLGAWTIELPERKLTWSDETCLIHDCPPGYQPTLEEGMSLFSPEHREEVARFVEACARDGTYYDIEVPKFTTKGRRIWVRSIGEAVHNAKGKIIRLQGALQDITESKRGELVLAQSNRALRMLTACSDALIHANDEPRLLAEICQLVVKLGGYCMAWVGYARDDAHHAIEPMASDGADQGFLSAIRLNWSEDVPGGRGVAGKVIRTGQTACYSDVANNPDFINCREEALARGYRSIIGLPLKNESHTFGLLTLYSSDVNPPLAEELKLLQELADDLTFGIVSLRAREERRIAQKEIAQKAALLDMATDAIVVRDLEHRVTFWNKGAERVYGWKAKEALGRSTRKLLSVVAPTFDTAVEAVLNHGEWTGEMEVRNKDGDVLTMDCRWTLVRDQQNQSVSTLCIETNATEKKKWEAQLLRSQRLESIGTLAGGIAHDLNNVLAPIMVSIQMLQEEAKNTEANKVLGILEKSVQRGAELIKQVLVFGRGIQGQRVEVNLVRLIRELQGVVHEVFPKNIEFEFATAKGILNVIGDPTQLHQVFLNLCVNARDAMPQGGKLTVGVENLALDETGVSMNPDAKPGAYAVVTVSDTGTGIPPRIRDRIFEPFFTTKEPGKGTGLGLSTAMGIVKSHGGLIDVNSQPGKGTQFMVYLPASTTCGSTCAETHQPGQLPRGNGQLVLLVDDEESVRSTVQRTLNLLGYEVVTAANGAEALTRYRDKQGEISLVLTDMSMPVMDGSALIPALKAMNPAVRIIASSGLGSTGGAGQAVKAGIRHFIPKPYTAETLAEALYRELAS